MPGITGPTGGQTTDAGITPTAGQTGQVQPEMFTKERVSELMRRRVDRSHQAFFTRYGVKDLNELDNLFGKATTAESLQQRIEELTKNGADLQSRIEELTNQNRELTKNYAFTSHNIKPEMYADIETYFKGKGLDITQETLTEELKTHPDWFNRAGTVTPLGAESHANQGPGERELASQLLGVQL